VIDPRRGVNHFTVECRSLLQVSFHL